MTPDAYLHWSERIIWVARTTRKSWKCFPHNVLSEKNKADDPELDFDQPRPRRELSFGIPAAAETW